MKKEYIDIKDLKKGHLRREKLSDFDEQWAKNIHHSLGDELAGPYEQFEFGFCYDQNHRKEMFVWNVIASSLEAWENNNPFCDRKEIFGQLLSFSLGAEVDNSLSPITILELKALMETVKSQISEHISKQIDKNKKN